MASVVNQVSQPSSQRVSRPARQPVSQSASQPGSQLVFDFLACKRGRNPFGASCLSHATDLPTRYPKKHFFLPSTKVGGAVRIPVAATALGFCSCKFLTSTGTRPRFFCGPFSPQVPYLFFFFAIFVRLTHTAAPADCSDKWPTTLPLVFGLKYCCIGFAGSK